MRTPAGREQVDEVFEFVVGDCELEITEAGAMPSFEAPETAASSWEGMVGSVVPPDVGGDVPTMEFSPSVVPPAGPPAAPSAHIEPSAPAITETPATAMTAPPAPAAPASAPAPAASDHPETAAPAPRPAATKAPGTGATTTRVELEKIDRVVNMVGELVIAQAMLGQVVQDLPEDVSGRVVQMLEEVIHHTRELKDSVMSMRAQPVNAVFQRMPRLVRELAPKTAKKVQLEMAGENTEVDRSIIERLGDPLTHIIRNSVDHGIESPADRAAAGKPEEGTIRLSAEHRGGRIVIEITDDGAGINSERVLQKARENGLVAADAVLSDDEINNLIFLPGFSTAEKISDISGRGVGMDVVRRNIQDVGGRISLKSDRGRGMTIQLALPLTLAVMDGMVIRVGRETYVMPMSAIVECLRPPASDIHALIGTPRHAAAARQSRAAGSALRSARYRIVDVRGRRTRHHHHRCRRGGPLRPRRRRTVRTSAGRGQEHRGELRLGSGHRRRHHSRQWPRRIHSRCREAVRHRQQSERANGRDPFRQW